MSTRTLISGFPFHEIVLQIHEPRNILDLFSDFCGQFAQHMDILARYFQVHRCAGGRTFLFLFHLHFGAPDGREGLFPNFLHHGGRKGFAVVEVLEIEGYPVDMGPGPPL